MSNRQTKSYNGNKADKSNGFSTREFTVLLNLVALDLKTWADTNVLREIGWTLTQKYTKL
jgi:hypothetical protein